MKSIEPHGWKEHPDYFKDQPTVEQLVDAIRQIDKSAADYIENDVLIRYAVTDTEPPQNLEDLFIWSESPQGAEFWRRIYLELEGK